MHSVNNTCKCMHTLRKKCIYTRACVHMQRFTRFFAMEAIANLSSVLREHRTGCRFLLAFDTVSTKSVARRCSLKKCVQIHASSWRGRRCGVVHGSFNHLRWCRPHPVCTWVVLEAWPQSLPIPIEIIFWPFFSRARVDLNPPKNFVLFPTGHFHFYIFPVSKRIWPYHPTWYILWAGWSVFRSARR